MSAYGHITRSNTSTNPLPSGIWASRNSSTNELGNITVHHLILATARQFPGLLDYLNVVFAKEIQDGMTYPQEGEMGKESFESYFFAADVFLGIVGQSSHTTVVETGNTVTSIGVEDARAGRRWEDCVAGFYYIKPNYPGRSSHICNAGFIVPRIKRGCGYGRVLANSYVHYAPKLGYQASVFNLVYVNNIASVKLWENLGFTKAGRIPSAGRLRRKDGDGEEFVDALVFYKRFSEI